MNLKLKKRKKLEEICLAHKPSYIWFALPQRERERTKSLTIVFSGVGKESIVILKGTEHEMTHVNSCYLQASLFWALGGLISGNLPEETKELSAGTSMFVHCDQPSQAEGAGSCSSPGG